MGVALNLQEKGNGNEREPISDLYAKRNVRP